VRVGVLLALVSIPATATGERVPGSFDPATVVAQVDGQTVTLEDLFFRLANQPAWARERFAADLDLFLHETVLRLLLVREAERLGLEREPSFGRLETLRREEVLLDLYARQTLLGDLDQVVAERYRAQREARFLHPSRVRVWQILATPRDETPDVNAEGADAVDLETARRKIVRIAGRLAAGEDRSLVARQESEDVSAAAGGDLGWRSGSQLIPELAAAVEGMQPGDVPRMVESPQGVHLVAVEARRPAGEVPLLLVRELLMQEIAGERMPALGDAVRSQRERIRAAGGAVLYPERLPW
jgi:hypothetical protein